MRAAIEVLADLPAPRLLVLGDMGEVGSQGPEFHDEALRLVVEKNIEKVFVTGILSIEAAINFESVERHLEMADLQAAVRATLPSVASVLVKGSRFMKMEQVVEAICAAADAANEGTPAC